MIAIDYLDLQITLRCNAACLNCIKLCNLGRITGLDYRDSDLTLDQVRAVIQDVRRVDARINHLVVTGGEPLLHPDAVRIVELLERELVPAHVGRVLVNSNLTLPVPAPLQPHLVNYSRPADAEQIHDAVFVDPAERGEAPRFAACTHYRKWRIVCNYLGYSLCCAADGYIRLFGFAHLIVDRLPEDFSGFPLAAMDDVCRRCAFGGTPLKQSAVGAPVSPIYAQQGELNRAGRTIQTRLRSGT